MIEILALLGLLVFAWLLFGVIFGAVISVVNFILMILVWIFIGFLAGQLIRGKGYGPIGDAALGIGGGIVGSIILRLTGTTNWNDGLIGGIVVGTIGAVVLVFFVRLVNKDFAK
ncbi:MAG: GlsB/YeaQ/YmgE family stress response membrane protein [Anaerolineae bacterium]|nr:GlsB/YeaQ/YmgE family stress response membrane protein [Anaerolineae bacterium]